MLAFYIKSGSGTISGKAAFFKDDKENSEIVTLDIKGSVDLHTDKERSINRFLTHSGSEDFLWGLIRLLGNKNAR